VLSPDDAQAIKAYLLKRAHDLQAAMTAASETVTTPGDG
jgi:hypothetical protein